MPPFMPPCMPAAPRPRFSPLVPPAEGGGARDQGGRKPRNQRARAAGPRGRRLAALSSNGGGGVPGRHSHSHGSRQRGVSATASRCRLALGFGLGLG